MRETLTRVLRSYGLSRGEAFAGDDLSSSSDQPAPRTDCDFDADAWDRGDQRSLAAYGIGRVVMNRLPAVTQAHRQAEDTGSPAWRAAIPVPPDADRPALERLHHQGVRGARFRASASAEGLDPILRFADRVAPLGWHIELDLGATDAYHALSKAEWKLMQFPVAVSFSGLSGFKRGRRADDGDVDFLLGLVQLGRYWLKLLADDLAPTQLPLWDEPPALARALQSARKDRLIWGSGKQAAGDGSMHLSSGLAMLEKWLPRQADRDAILIDNPARLYGFDGVAH